MLDDETKSEIQRESKKSLVGEYCVLCLRL